MINVTEYHSLQNVTRNADDHSEGDQGLYIQGRGGEASQWGRTDSRGGTNVLLPDAILLTKLCHWAIAAWATFLLLAEDLHSHFGELKLIY